MAGAPKPCVMSEKLVRCRWKAGSSTGDGRIAPCGERSCPSTSASSLITCLQTTNELVLRPFLEDNLDNAAPGQSAVLKFHATP